MAAKTSAAVSAAKKAVAKATGRGSTSSGSTTPPAKKTTSKQSPAKKSAAGDSSAKKAATKQAATKKAGGEQTPAKRSGGKKAAPAKKAPAAAKKTTPAKKAPAAAKTASTTKVAARKSASAEPATKAPESKKPTTKKSTATGGSKAARANGATGGLVVRSDEKPWTAAEIKEVQATLEHDRSRLVAEIEATEADINHLLRGGGEGAGNDQADVGSNTFERDHEMSMAKNARDNLELVESALARIKQGDYGVCGSCGQPIGKMRLQAFPRATLCMECKQRQERR